MIRSTRFQTALLLTMGFSIASLAGCSESSQEPAVSLRILVTNDDGVGAPGINGLIEALVADPNNQVVVSAPAENASGSADWTVNDPSPPAPPCATGTGEATPASTLSGYDQDVWAVDGCPADAVNYALDPANGLYAADSLPHVVISGINGGQNVSAPVATAVSGTVGAAKTAARDHGIPALASSQGMPAPDGEYDYPAGVQAVLAWLAERRGALAAGSVTTTAIDNLNIPSCKAGSSSIRGAVDEVPMAESADGAFSPQNCQSSLENPQDDVEALNNGYITLGPVPAN